MAEITVYISIGNSDDKLTQAHWAEFVGHARAYIKSYASTVHGDWLSTSDSPYQNACWCAVLPSRDVANALRTRLNGLRENYRQDSIAWAVVPVTEFIA